MSVSTTSDSSVAKASTPNVVSAIRNFSTTVPIVSCKLTRDDLVRLYQIIDERQIEQRDKMVARLSQLPTETPEDFRKRYDSVFSAFVTTVTLTGIDGEQISGNTAHFLTGTNVPDRISNVYYSTSSAPTALLNFTPPNRVSVFLDFSRPPLLDFTKLPTLATPNSSNFSINSDGETWFTAINARLTQFFKERRVSWNWLHSPGVYDGLLFIVGLPITLWGAYRAGATFQLSKLPQPITVAVYIYLFFLILMIFRLLFSYARWAFPRIEIDSVRSPASRHRAVWAGLVLAVGGGIILDILKAIL